MDNTGFLKIAAGLLALVGFAANLYAVFVAASGNMSLPTVIYQLAGIACILLAFYVNQLANE